MFSIRRMEPQDLDGVLRVERESFSVPWTRESFLLDLASPIASYLVAVGDDGAILGYGGFWAIAGQADITNIAVRKDSRNKGIGSELLEELIKLAVLGGSKVMHLEVRASNEAAKRIYERYGFVMVGIRKDYYREPDEDAILYSLDLRLD